MGLSIQVGQTGTLVFTPHTVGIDPANVVGVDWVMQTSQQIIRFTEPDQIEGKGPGTGGFKVMVTLTQQEKITYPFEIACVTPGPTPIPPVVPVVIDDLRTPPP